MKVLYVKISEPLVVIVTRHPALVTLLREMNLVPEGTEIISHASTEDVRGKHVFGVLPLHLAAEAYKITEVTLSIPPDKRGVELTLEDLKEMFQGVSTYKVEKL